MAEHRWTGGIQSRDDARRVLAKVNTAGLTRTNITALAAAVRRADQTALQPDAAKLLPAPPELQPLLPSNDSFSGWTKTVTDPRHCAAIVDRLAFGATSLRPAPIPTASLNRAQAQQHD